MTTDRIIVVGAGIAGLCAAIDLAAAGHAVTVLEKAPAAGGKMRQVGGVDAGPTVFTMRWVFEDLFARAGRRFTDYVTPVPAGLLARHAWDGPAAFDLYADADRSEAAVGAFFGPREAAGFRRFLRDAGEIHDLLRDTFMAAPRPGPMELGMRVGLGRLPAMFKMRPFTTMWQALGDYFADPRLRQLFGRYATYVGSSPFQAPATLMLVAHVECQGVWLIDGGMIALAAGLQRCAEDLGATFAFETGVREITTNGGRASGVITEDGRTMSARAVIWNGDVSALADGKAGSGVARAAQGVAPAERSLSAITWTGRVKADGFPLVRHNVFFSDAYKAEFDAIFKRRTVPTQPTVYVCAQDRDDTGTRAPGVTDERVLCLINAPADGDRHRLTTPEIETCQRAMHTMLNRAGLTLAPSAPGLTATTPADFETLFPGSGGSLYGRASHGWTASFQRAGAKSRVPGLYMAGGSVHPGAGVPMAALSGGLAARALTADLTSRSRSRRTGTTGGTSTR